jgi:hypothetical protein
MMPSDDRSCEACHDPRAVRATSPRSPRALALTLAVVALTAAIAPAAVAGRGPAHTLAPLAPVPGTTCVRPSASELRVDSDLTVPSDVSAWSIDAFLSRATPLPPLGAAFKLAESRYGVNALYLLAHAMLESNFGRSYIAQNFKNLFGWTAYDRDPVAFATRFPTFETSVDYVAMQIARLYLDPGGVHYGGAPTLRGMYRYATDPLWETSIARIANSLCLPTLAGSGITLSSALEVGELKPGESALLTIAASNTDALPDGLRLAARARLLGASGPISNDLSTYALTPAVSDDGAFRLPVEAGALPGAYTLDFLLLDTTGGVLPTADQVAIPPVSLSVVARHAVMYAVNQTALGLFVSLQSVGSEAIPAGPTVSAATMEILFTASGPGDPGTDIALAPPAPRVLASVHLTEPLGPGDSRGFQLPITELDLPGVLYVRVLAVDAAGAPIDLPTGAFSLTRDVSSIGAGASGAAPGPQPLVITQLAAEFPTAGPVSIAPLPSSHD